MMKVRTVSILCGCAIAVGIAGFNPAAHADVLTNGNTSLNIDPAGATVYDWTVDGIDQLGLETFYYRIGSTGGESSVGLLNLVNTTTTTVGFPKLTASYNNVNMSPEQSFNLTISWTLIGGTSGSGISDVQIAIQLDNTSGQEMDMHFFQYADFDLNGTSTGDHLVITGGNTATQTEAGVTVGETVDAPSPSHYSAHLISFDLLGDLGDSAPTTLDDNVGPVTGDATWAFQWDATLSATGSGSSLTIGKDQQISPVPEPATVAMVGAGLALIASRKRRRA